jgi:hypothetical protein
MHEKHRESLNQTKGGERVRYNKEESPLGNPKESYSEIDDIFPALNKYKNEHNTVNLQKLCVEILEFCRSVYASTRSEDERKIYHNFVEKLNK